MVEGTTEARLVGEVSGAVLAEMTTEVVAAYVAHTRVQPGDIPGLITFVHAAFDRLSRASEPEATVTKPTLRVSIRKTITDTHLINLEDGKAYKSLKRHLTRHGLTPEAYRAKWDLPSDYPMVSPAYARQRSELAKGMGLGSMRRKC